MWRYNTATNASVSPNTNHNNDCYCVGELMKSRVVCKRLFGHACQVGWAKANRFEKKTGMIIVARCINVLDLSRFSLLLTRLCYVNRFVGYIFYLKQYLFCRKLSFKDLDE